MQDYKMHKVTLDDIMADWALWPNLCSTAPNSNEFSTLAKGLTNQNWLYKPAHAGGPYVIRVNAPNASELNLNRHAEWHIHRAVAGFDICPQFVYRDPADRYWIRHYLQGDTLADQLAQTTLNNDDIVALALALKQVHALPTSTSWPAIDFDARTQYYWNQVELVTGPLTKDLTTLKHQLDLLSKARSYSPRLCHMDPNPNNWILHHNQPKLIDWEYAALGNPLWDIATLIDTCHLNDTQAETLIHHYGNVPMRDIEQASKQMQYLSALWFAVQKQSDQHSLIEELSALL